MYVVAQPSGHFFLAQGYDVVMVATLVGQLDGLEMVDMTMQSGTMQVEQTLAVVVTVGQRGFLAASAHER